MNNKKAIPAKTKKLIFQEAQSRCPFCDESDVNVLEIHHITEQTDGGGNEPSNLILVCSNCHSKITSGSITKLEVVSMKTKLSQSSHSPESTTKPSNIINITGGQHSGVIANVVNLKTSRKRPPKLSYPEGSIGSNLLFRNYVKYLIDRYNEFKKANRTVSDFHYAVVYRSIQAQFKAKWDFIPIERFTDLVVFLQNRIDKTILGKVQKARSYRNYESLEEFKLKMKSQR